MIRKIEQKDLTECVKVIRDSFATDENRLNWHLNGEHRQCLVMWRMKKL